MKKNNQTRYLQLKELLKNSYSPYSQFATAAIVTTDQGEFEGVNVENASFTAGICAERNALFNAMTNGSKVVKQLDLISSSHSNEVIPCGVCLQALTEFMDPKAPIVVYNIDGKVKKYLFKDLMPVTFKKKEIPSQQKKKKQ